MHIYWIYKWAENIGIPKNKAIKALAYKEYLQKKHPDIDIDTLEILVINKYQSKNWKSFGVRLMEACEKEKGKPLYVKMIGE